LTNFSFLSGLTSLTTLGLNNNELTSLTLPGGLERLYCTALEPNVCPA